MRKKAIKRESKLQKNFGDIYKKIQHNNCNYNIFESALIQYLSRQQLYFYKKESPNLKTKTSTISITFLLPSSYCFNLIIILNIKVLIPYIYQSPNTLLVSPMTILH